MSKNTSCFTKDNLDTYLKALAKEFRKRNGTSMPAEIILIGGAAILTNYGFRDITTDIDAIIHASSSMKDAIIQVRDKFDLPDGWINTDFIKTASYSPRLEEFSIYYRTFSNILTIRTISAEYLIAMKLRAGRKYKHDLSDIIGILAEHEKTGNPISIKEIDTAVINLYGGWDDFSEDSKQFITSALDTGHYQELFSSITKEEQRSKDVLIEFENNYPQVTTESNVNDILKTLKSKKHLHLDK